MAESEKTYYECHLTLEGDSAKLRPLVEGIKWKFSCIAGDIVLGDGVKCYATRHFNARVPQEHVLTWLHRTGDALESQGVKVVRRKVELVVYDDRSTKTQSCNGGCVECHLDDSSPSEDEIDRVARAIFDAQNSFKGLDEEPMLEHHFKVAIIYYRALAMAAIRATQYTIEAAKLPSDSAQNLRNSATERRNLAAKICAQASTLVTPATGGDVKGLIEQMIPHTLDFLSKVHAREHLEQHLRYFVSSVQAAQRKMDERDYELGARLCEKLMVELPRPTDKYSAERINALSLAATLFSAAHLDLPAIRQCFE